MDKTDWVVSKVVAAQARARGDKVFLQEIGGRALTYGETDTATNRLANGLMKHGVAHGERVGVMLPNGLEICLTWFALSRLGAVNVFINTAYKGAFLTHLLNNAETRLILIAAEFLPWLADIEGEIPALKTAIVLGEIEAGTRAAFQRIELLPYAEAAGGDQDRSPADAVEREVAYHDIGAIMYTSGTTGPSKGVLMPHAHLYLMGYGVVENLRLSEADIYYICMPLFHANALLLQLFCSLIVGCKVVIAPRFSASAWLDHVREHGVTVTNTLGVMAGFIFRQPERPEDADNALRLILAVPAPTEIHEAFEQRFNTRLIEGYGMTEVNIPLYHPLDGPYRPGSCGKIYERFFEVRVVDPDTDQELPPGEMGELVVRPREPFCFMQGYNRMPEKTVEAWRNFWFHTGDALKMDEDGYFYFIDRIKDCIRVRGENVSSYEIEAILAEYPGVAEVAAIAVKSDLVGGEDEIKACIVLKPGAETTPEALLDFCRERMPHFAVPRYVEFTAALPKTPTETVRKAQLREAGITPATWDREAAGYQVRRRA